MLFLVFYYFILSYHICINFKLYIFKYKILFYIIIQSTCYRLQQKVRKGGVFLDFILPCKIESTGPATGSSLRTHGDKNPRKSGTPPGGSAFQNILLYFYTLNLYPTPHIVSIYCGLDVSTSTFSRIFLICTVTVAISPMDSISQISRNNSSLEYT